MSLCGGEGHVDLHRVFYTDAKVARLANAVVGQGDRKGGLDAKAGARLPNVDSPSHRFRHTVQGQRIVVTPGRGAEWLGWLKQMLAARGLNVLESTAEQHDRVMSIVQVLTHFSTEVMGRTLTSLGASVEETLKFTSPVYLMELLMTARHFAQSPELYASIQMSNPATPRVTDAFVTAADELRKIVNAKDRAAFAKSFEDVRDHFGDFTQQALEQSSYLIDRLVERA